jgi:GNAT superfamily N-acetyltransferase
VSDVAARHRLHRITRADEPAFSRAFDALEEEFGARGELERRVVIERWLARDESGGRTDIGNGRRTSYHLIEATDDDGELAAVRDCHVIIDGARNVVVVYLAHVLVDPAHRRRGISALMRSAAMALGRTALAELDVPSAGAASSGATNDLVLVAEMEPASVDDTPSLVRLVAYGRAGFSVIDPRALPYVQPDFRDPEDIGASPQPVPLLLVVQWVGHEATTALPRELAEAVVTSLHDGVFASHCREDHLTPARDVSLSALAAWGADDLPLCPLPRDVTDRQRLAPLSREGLASSHSGERNA